MAKITGWFTTDNGAHVPIIDGESKVSAMKRFAESKHGKTVAKLSSKTTNKENNSTRISNFQKMNEKELQELSEDVLYGMDRSELNKQGLNGGSETQRLVEKLNLNDKPNVVSSEEFDKNSKGKDLLYRGVKGVEKRVEGEYITLTAEQIQNNLKYGNKTYIGEGFYGDGIYFSGSKRVSYEEYSDKTKGSLVTAYLDKSKSFIIKYDDLKTLRDKYRDSSDAARSLVNSGIFREYSSFALYKGYNVVQIDSDARGQKQYVVLTRDCLVIRED